MGDVRYASVYPHSRFGAGFFWVAREDGVPFRNTSGDVPQTEIDAKASALEYVRNSLANAPITDGQNEVRL